MKNQVLLIAVCSVSVLLAASNDVVIKNLKLFVGGEEFFIKGMCYSPAPLGLSESGGFCSDKTTPYGDVESACYDSDYFDGGPDVPNRDPAGPSNGWFQAVWDRDFPNLQQLGVNTLRLYSANPATKLASIQFPSIIPLPYGKDHTEFMDLAAQYNIKVIFPLIADYGMMLSTTTEDFEQYLRWQIEEIGNKSSLLMWAFGNELPLNGNPSLIDMVNGYINYARNYQLSFWGRSIPITTAVVDDPSSYNSLVADLDVDVFTTNAGYRGNTFTDLWSGDSVSLGLKELSCMYNKPVLIGEMGWMSLDNAILATDPGWFNSLYEDLVAHVVDGCIGGSFFEYQDEVWKSDPTQQTMGVVSVAANVVNGESSLSPNVWLADIATPKNIIFAAVQSGLFEGEAYNMNSNVFTLLGRPQYTLADVPGICPVVSSSTVASTSTSSSTSSSTKATSASTVATSSTKATTASSSTKATSASTSTTAATSSTKATTAASSSTKATTAASSSTKATSASTTAATSSTKATTGITSSTKATSTASSSTSTKASTKASSSTSSTSTVGTSSTSKATSASTSSTTGLPASSSAACESACGAASCCPAATPICYDSSSYSCIGVGSSYQLCGVTIHSGETYFNGYCGAGCYDTYCYSCSDNGLVASGNC